MSNSEVKPQDSQTKMDVSIEYKEIDSKIEGIPALLDKFRIERPDASKSPFTTSSCWFVWSVIFIVAAAFATVYLVCANGLCEKSCNNLVLVSMFVLGFSAFVIFGLLKLLVGMQKQSNAMYTKELEMFDCYRKMMLERKIKDEDALRNIYFEKLKKS